MTESWYDALYAPLTSVRVADFGYKIYRAYVVWDRSFKVIIPPFILLAGELGRLPSLDLLVNRSPTCGPSSWLLRVSCGPLLAGHLGLEHPGAL